ncbi:hypothetical protein BVG16_27075 [Paenibacillus selenitireducens]|uniref:VOC domain-containing protein n=1 Tax=Paenibacillus selenitireducens TaxID=1324314 RepID=A0A1T2X1M2_9BACL|nr:VOC family protein [Paenibacillus selenitireducens]OPA73752.1 hypothetical protein BVG16_27075 [Paenibacillus selenitireducens]
MTQPFHFSQIGYVYVPTPKLDESIAWYTKHLSFQLINKFQDRGSYLAVLHHPHQHAIALLLIETEDDHPLQISRNGKPFPIMALNCPNIEFTYDSLKNSGVEVEKLHTLGENEAKYFYFKDQVGNLLEAAWSKWDTTDDVKEGFMTGMEQG